MNESAGNVVWYRVGDGSLVSPEDPLPPLPEIPRGALVVITGRAPIWRYGLAFHKLHGSAAGAIATFDPKLGAVVVAVHVPGVYQAGQVLSGLAEPEEGGG